MPLFVVSTLHELFPQIPSHLYDSLHFYCTLFTDEGAESWRGLNHFSQTTELVGDRGRTGARGFTLQSSCSEPHTALGCPRDGHHDPWAWPCVWTSCHAAPSHWRFPIGSCVEPVFSVHPCVSLLAQHQHLSEPFNIWTCLRSVALPPSASALGLEYAGVGGWFLNICEFPTKSGNVPNETKHRALFFFPAVLFSGDGLSLGWHMGHGTCDVFLSCGLRLNCLACKKCWKSTSD